MKKTIVKLKDGTIYEIICPKHGETVGLCIGRQLVCSGSEDGIHLSHCEEKVELK